MKMNLPNKLTILRMILIPVFMAFYFLDMIPYNHVIAAGVFALAAFTDFLDGKIARKYNLVTNFGKFLDPIADKALVSTALIIYLTSAIAGKETLGFDPTIAYACCASVIVMRELIISGFRMIAAKNQVVLAADIWGKAKTFVTDFALAFLLVGTDLDGRLGEVVLVIGYVLFAIATLLTVISGVNYILKNPDVLKDKA